MSAPNDVITRLRSTGTNLMQTRSDGQAQETGVLYARARPRRVEITERYRVEQEISNSPKIDIKANRSGHIEVAVPYDGRDYFTRQARDDVSHGSRGREITPDHKVRIGHLLLDNDSRTNLREVLREHSSEGSLPLELTFAEGADLDAFCADRATCRITHDYLPDRPEIIPLTFEVEVLDPDSVDLPDIDLLPSDKNNSAQGIRERIRQHNVINKIRQQVSFRNTLAVHLRASLTVPDPDPDTMSQDAEPKATLARVAIAWPTITSLRTLDLRLVDEEHPPREHRVTYNPVAECVEWYGVPMDAPSSQHDDNGMRTYYSPWMVLSIEQPGELYEQKNLTVTAEAKVGGYLLSGLGARLYDAQGYASEACTPELTTRVGTKVGLVLDDAFRKRTISPYQHWFFDEIIPDEMRVTDIMTALQDRKFTVSQIKMTDGTHDGTILGTDSWFIGARRQEGPDKMDLWLFVEGTSFEVQRDRMQTGDGSEQRLRRTLKSGELRIFIRGALPQNSRSITHEMNALHQMLRERYEYVRSHG